MVWVVFSGVKVKSWCGDQPFCLRYPYSRTNQMNMRFLLLGLGCLLIGCTSYNSEWTDFELADQFIEVDLRDGRTFRLNAVNGARNTSELVYAANDTTGLGILRRSTFSASGSTHATLRFQLPIYPDYLNPEGLLELERIPLPQTLDSAFLQVQSYIPANNETETRMEVFEPVRMQIDARTDRVITGTLQPNPIVWHNTQYESTLANGSFRVFIQPIRE